VEILHKKASMLLWWDLSVDVNKHLFIREPNFIIYINSYFALEDQHDFGRIFVWQEMSFVIFAPF